jgi:hypothetical protein
MVFRNQTASRPFAPIALADLIIKGWDSSGFRTRTDDLTARIGLELCIPTCVVGMMVRCQNMSQRAILIAEHVA